MPEHPEPTNAMATDMRQAGQPDGSEAGVGSASEQPARGAAKQTAISNARPEGDGQAICGTSQAPLRAAAFRP